MTDPDSQYICVLCGACSCATERHTTHRDKKVSCRVQHFAGSHGVGRCFLPPSFHFGCAEGARARSPSRGRTGRGRSCVVRNGRSPAPVQPRSTAPVLQTRALKAPSSPLSPPPQLWTGPRFSKKASNKRRFWSPLTWPFGNGQPTATRFPRIL